MPADVLVGAPGPACAHASERGAEGGVWRGSNKFPDPEGLVAKFNAAGMRLAANLKPCLLDDHPMFSGTQHGRQGGKVLAMSRLDVAASADHFHAHVHKFLGCATDACMNALCTQRCVQRIHRDLPCPARPMRATRSTRGAVSGADRWPAAPDVAARGAFIAGADGQPSIGQFWDGEGAHLDFTNPAAIKWCGGAPSVGLGQDPILDHALQQTGPSTERTRAEPDMCP